MTTRWGRWLPGKWHALSGRVDDWTKQRYGTDAVETLCGRKRREPDQMSADPLLNQCQTCVEAVIEQAVKAA